MLKCDSRHGAYWLQGARRSAVFFFRLVFVVVFCQMVSWLVPGRAGSSRAPLWQAVHGHHMAGCASQPALPHHHEATKKSRRSRQLGKHAGQEEGG